MLLIGGALLAIGAAAAVWHAIPTRAAYDAARVDACARLEAFTMQQCVGFEQDALLCDGGAPVCGRPSGTDEQVRACVIGYRFMRTVPDGPTVDRFEGTEAWCRTAARAGELCVTGMGKHDNPFVGARTCDWVSADGVVDASRAGLAGAPLMLTRLLAAVVTAALGILVVLWLLRAAGGSSPNGGDPTRLDAPHAPDLSDE